MKKLAPLSRILLGLSSLMMIVVFYVPVWKIELKAPQYPEGLGMKIWLNNITGQVDIINGLNHYIGMKKISAASFPEFAYMPLIVGILIAAGVLAAFIGRRIGITVYLLLLIVAAGAGLYDFYQWSYDYGHNLDPTAPIQVPGLSYQPPLIGYKNLLNFEAFSFPDTGGLIFFASGFITLLIFLYELVVRKNKQASQRSFSGNHSAVAAIFLFAFSLFSCSSGPEPLNYGRDECQHCRMTLMDEKFGAEVINKNGKAYKFDDVGCLLQFVKAGNVKEEAMSEIYVVDFGKTKELLPLEKAQFLFGEGIKAPMGSKIAAFDKDRNISQEMAQLNAEPLAWKQIRSKY
jgi:copper chaperone NosL